MRAANWNSLQDKIIRPGIEEKLTPLLLYRGSRSLGHIHRLWNFAIVCMEHEVEYIQQTVKLSQNPDYAHLCGPHRPWSGHAAHSFFGKLEENPSITDNIPGFTEYVRDIGGFKFSISRVHPYVEWQGYKHTTKFSPWRIVRINTPDGEREVSVQELLNNPQWAHDGTLVRRQRATPKTPRIKEKTAADLFYPFILHDPSKPKEGEELVRLVNAAVPASWPDFLRADVCQDLIVAILTGEISKDELHPGNVKEFSTRVFRMHPTKYAPISLDAPVPGTDKQPWNEII
jgi:hypothetical protein